MTKIKINTYLKGKRKMKRIFALLLAALLAVTLISCTKTNDDTNDEENKTDVAVIYEEADLVAIADSLYEGLAEDQRPFVMSMPLTSEDFEFFTFIPYEEGLEAVANEPMMSSIAHSIVLVKAPTAEKAEETTEETSKKVQVDSAVSARKAQIADKHLENMSAEDKAKLIAENNISVGGEAVTIDENGNFMVGGNAASAEQIVGIKAQVFDSMNDEDKKAALKAVKLEEKQEDAEKAKSAEKSSIAEKAMEMMSTEEKQKFLAENNIELDEKGNYVVDGAAVTDPAEIQKLQAELYQKLSKEQKVNALIELNKAEGSGSGNL
ncbi:MAG: hypothetical protein IJ939_02075, partial [Clostridia bacterium]|nr:hypothetical protein [Clostridia bacterium]